MSDVVERRIGDLTVRIDRHLCVGFADCLEEAPEAFALDDEGIADFRSEAGGTARGRILAASEACPVDAIAVLDADGTPLAPS